MKTRTRLFAGWILLFLLLSLFAVVPAEAMSASPSKEASGKDITIMTYNVMDDVAPDANGNFKYASPAEREDAIAVMLKKYQPDVIGMQEAGDGGYSGVLDWCSALNEDLKSIYAYRSLKDDTGLKLDICRGLIIFYKKDRFTLLETGGQGYSQPANNKRCYHWVKLLDKETGVEFYVFNTHWHVDGKISLEENEAIRTSQMQELADKVKSLAKDQHVFLTGDFNSFYEPKNSMGDTVNITRLLEQTGFKDALMETEEKYSIDAEGTETFLLSSDKNLRISADHVVYPPNFYTPVRLERILSRTYTPMLSDHDGFIVRFSYNLPNLSAESEEGKLDVYYSNGAFYIDNLSKRTKALSVQVQLPEGKIYTDEACTQSAGADLTIKCATSKTYLSENTYYIKFGNIVYPLYLRSCNSNTQSETMFVDRSMAAKAPGSDGLYCDKWYCRRVTVGVNGFATIQEAVDAAKDGYRIMVAPGTYHEEVAYTGKSLQFQGSNRNNVKALVMKNGQLEVNTSGRTYETYLSGSISFSFGTLQTGSLEVNGFHFIDSAPLGQIRILGGNAKKTVNLRISNNLFNCYTYGATNSGSALVGNSALQKTGSIEDNYFHLTQVPTYENDSGDVLNYGNRAITLRNMRAITINGNYFNGYTGDKIRPVWLASEVSDGNTTAGYGNLALTGNRFENSTNGTIYINNIRDDTEANVLIAGNSYGGEKLTVTFNETASQISQNLPTDKSKITFSVQTEDLPHLNILPKADSGVSVKEFQYYVTFRNDKGHAVFGHSIVTGTSAPYTGPTPTKATDASGIYAFHEWVDVDGKSLDLNNITATTDAYASFTKTAHTPVVSRKAEPTCTEPGYTGDTDCTVCGHRIETGTVIPATGHTAVTDKGTPATCTEGGLSDGSHCKVCKVVLTVQEPMAPLGHAYEAVVTTVPTFTATGVRTFTCKHNASHTYTEAVDALSKSLYFTFDNDGASEARYNNFVYNFMNFDTVEAWRGRTQGYEEGSVTLDSKAGALTVKPGITGFPSIFADSVNFDLNYDPEYAECFQIRFKAKGFTGTSFKTGIYFYYSTDNSYVASGSVVVDAELLKDGDYFVAEAVLPDRVRNLDEVNRVVIYLSNFDTATDLLGAFTLDYAYAGPYETLPTSIYTVTFKDGAGKVLETHKVYKGESVTYTGPTPTMAYDAACHYTFTGWDRDLTNITADTVITATFASQAHSYVYGKEDTNHHTASCTCGYSKSEAHSYTYKAVQTPTLYAEGALTGTCSHCGDTVTVSLPKLNTSDYIKTVVKAATCTETGTDEYTWKTTDYGTFGFTVITAKLGHQYDTGVVTTAPTFTEKGVKTFTCENDSTHTYTQEMEILSKALFFDFTDDTAAHARYNNFVYNFKNFDTVEAWRGRTTGYKEGSANLDPTAGILTVSPGVAGFTSIFADSVNFDLNYDPEYAECFQIRFKANGFTGDSFKAGIYFYYSTDNSYMSSGSVVVDAELLKDGEYFVAEADLPDRVRNLDEVNRIVVYLSGFDTATDLMGTFSLDYVYAGPYETLPSNPTEDSNLKLSHSLNLASDISVNLAVAKTTLAGFDMSTVYVESVIETYTGNEKSGTTTVRITPVEQGNFYYFTLTGLTAVNMNDRIVSTLYGTKDGQAYASPVDDYSISDYAYAQLNKTSVPNKLKTLCADLLRYGAKAQVYKNYRTDFPADSKMTEDHKAYLSPIEAVVFGSTNVTLNDLENAPIVWAGKALNLESKVALKFMFKLGAYTGSLSDLTLRVSYEDVGGNIKSATITNPELYSEAMGIYVFTVDTLLAAELRSVVSVQVYAGNTPLSCTLQYSADTYGNNKTGKLLELCKALFAYCDSAKAYFAN